MDNASFKEYISNRECKCRICGRPIPKDTSHIKFGPIYVNGNHATLHLHTDCLALEIASLTNMLKEYRFL